MNISKHSILKDLSELNSQIEKCGCSSELTDASIMCIEIMTKLEEIFDSAKEIAKQETPYVIHEHRDTLEERFHSAILRARDICPNYED